MQFIDHWLIQRSVRFAYSLRWVQYQSLFSVIKCFYDNRMEFRFGLFSFVSHTLVAMKLINFVNFTLFYRSKANAKCAKRISRNHRMMWPIRTLHRIRKTMKTSRNPAKATRTSEPPGSVTKLSKKAVRTTMTIPIRKNLSFEFDVPKADLNSTASKYLTISLLWTVERKANVASELKRTRAAATMILTRAHGKSMAVKTFARWYEVPTWRLRRKRQQSGKPSVKSVLKSARNWYGWFEIAMRLHSHWFCHIFTVQWNVW